MTNFKNVWNHWALKSFMTLIGILGFVMKLTNVFAQTKTIILVSTIALSIAIAYIFILFLHWGGTQILFQLAKHISKNMDINQQSLGSQTVGDETHYLYQAKRYGIGYRKFDVQCIIDMDGSANVIREVELEAFSEISELDTFINIPEAGSDGRGRDIKIGNITSLDGRKLSLKVQERKPGRMNAKIRIAPPLTSGETLAYRIHDFYLPPGMFSIDLSKEELQKRENPDSDYFGWHVNRPTQNFKIQVFFPQGKQPDIYQGEVRYASSAGNPSTNHQYEEQKQLDRPDLNWNIDRHVLSLAVKYPLSGLIYILGWKPLIKD